MEDDFIKFYQEKKLRRILEKVNATTPKQTLKFNYISGIWENFQVHVDI